MTTPKATHQLQGSILAITPCEDSTFCVERNTNELLKCTNAAHRQAGSEAAAMSSSLTLTTQARGLHLLSLVSTSNSG